MTVPERFLSVVTDPAEFRKKDTMLSFNKSKNWLLKRAMREDNAFVGSGGPVGKTVDAALLFEVSWKSAERYLPEESGEVDVRCRTSAGESFETRAWFDSGRGWVYPGNVVITHWRRVPSIYLLEDSPI